MDNITENEEIVKYENQMLKAYVNNPEKTFWYQNAFRQYKINGIDKMAWNWSWWAFFGGVFFLLYRKAYLEALGLFFLSLVSSAIIPFFGGIIVSILAGGFSTYFLYKGYEKKKFEIERTIDDSQKRLETMRILGGYNTWAIWVAGIIYTILTLLFIGIIVEAA